MPVSVECNDQTYHFYLDDSITESENHMFKLSKRASKRAWVNEHDEQLLLNILEIGPQQWETMALKMPGRTGK